MEFLELQSVWRELSEELDTQPPIAQKMIETFIRRSSSSTVELIKQTMYYKFIAGSLSLLLTIGLNVGLFLNPNKFSFYEDLFTIPENHFILGTISLFLVIMLVSSYRGFRQILLFQKGVQDIKTSLQQLILIMRKVVRVNSYLGAIFLSIIATWTYYAAFFKGDSLTAMNTWIGFFMVATLSFGFAFWMNKFSQKRKFGHFVNQLENNLKELKSS